MGRVSSAERAAQKAATGRYQIQSEIAAGGMGVVYRVRDRLTGDLQALKRVATNSSARRQAVETL